MFVTTYEGVSLSSIAKKKGGLTSTIKDKARASLRELHANGVVHGDPALRNVLWRERDQSVIWVDFELATVGGENFHALAQNEVLDFEKYLDLVYTRRRNGYCVCGNGSREKETNLCKGLLLPHAGE